MKLKVITTTDKQFKGITQEVSLENGLPEHIFVGDYTFHPKHMRENSDGTVTIWNDNYIVRCKVLG